MSLLLADIKMPYMHNRFSMASNWSMFSRRKILESLNFEAHVAEKVNKSNTIAGLIQRSFSHLNSRVFQTLFGSFVRPHLEYAAVVSMVTLSEETYKPDRESTEKSH